MRPIEEACYWMDTHTSDAEPWLEGSLRSDITIVGAGFTGLWTALILKELDPGADVVVLEQERVGYGGSGRNGGIFSETIDHSHQLATSHFGMQEAQKLAGIGQQNLEEMISFLAANQIDCELESTGRLFVALTESQMADGRRSIAAAEALGVTGMRFLSKDEVQAEIHSPLYLGGVFSPIGGILNPMKLVHGLKRGALQRGVRIFEHTPVNQIRKNKIRISSGEVTARKIILATDAYTHQLFPRLLWHFIPLYDYILVSEPLSESRRETIGWKNRQGVTDGRTFFNYYRLTADNRILWGTSEAMYYPPNRIDRTFDHSERHYRALRESFVRHFPQLSDLKFPYAWGGPIAATTRLTPFFGSLENGSILFALGYTGHGIGSTHLAGKILAHMALGLPSDLLELVMVRKKPFPYPPEPFRRLAVHSVTRSLRRVDAGGKPNLLLRTLDLLRIGFSS